MIQVMKPAVVLTWYLKQKNVSKKGINLFGFIYFQFLSGQIDRGYIKSSGAKQNTGRRADNHGAVIAHLQISDSFTAASSWFSEYGGAAHNELTLSVTVLYWLNAAVTVLCVCPCWFTVIIPNSLQIASDLFSPHIILPSPQNSFMSAVVSSSVNHL